MGLADWFTNFCSNLTLQDGNTVSARRKLITRRLNADFRSTTSETSNSFYVGSYGRNTAIKGASDVDLLFEMPYSEYATYDAYSTNGQSALLQSVKQSIALTYPSTKVGGDGQVVVIRFTDGISFDVLPAFINKDQSYTFANANHGGSWKTTDPKPEIEAIKQRNIYCNGNLVLLCRMIRAWKDAWNVDIGGLLIDTLAYQFMIDWPYKDKSYFYHDFMCRDFFKYLADISAAQTYFKAPGSGRHVYVTGPFQYRAKQCYNLALSAIVHEQAKEEWSARQRWRDIFGAAFPN